LQAHHLALDDGPLHSCLYPHTYLAAASSAVTAGQQKLSSCKPLANLYILAVIICFLMVYLSQM